MSNVSTSSSGLIRPERSTLLAAADPHMAVFAGQDSFEKSLVHHILFSEMLCLHEAYYFTSPRIIKHIDRYNGDPSLFEVASEEGIILPAIRGKDGDLESILRRCEEYYGPGYRPAAALSPDTPMRRSMFRYVSRGIDKTKGGLTWPSQDQKGRSSGEIYLDNVRAHLQREEPPGFLGSVSENHGFNRGLWNATKVWRCELVEEAAAKTAERGKSGLGRLEAFQLLAAKIGHQDLVDSDPTSSQLLEGVDDRLKHPLFAFVEWLTRLHAMSVANHIGCMENFPSFEPTTDVFFQVGRPQEAGFSEISHLETLICEVHVPDPALILEQDPRNVTEARRTFGVPYFDALRDWMERDGTGGDTEVRQRLERYASRLCAKFPGRQNRLVAQIDKTIGPLRKPLQTLISLAVSGGAWWAGMPPLAGAGIFVGVQTLGHVIYYFESKRLNNIPRRERVEISRLRVREESWHRKEQQPNDTVQGNISQ